MAPKRAAEASRSHFGTIFGAKMEPRGFIFGALLEHFGALFWSLSPFALAIFAPFWEPKWSPEASFWELFWGTLGLYFSPTQLSLRAPHIMNTPFLKKGGIHGGASLGLYFGHIRPLLSQASRL